MKKLCAIGLLLFSCTTLHKNIPPPDPVYYYGGIYGNITSAQTKTPIDSVQVTIFDTEFNTLSDSSGNYFFYDIPFQSYSVSYIRSGYDTFFVADLHVQKGEILNLDIKLKPVNDVSAIIGYLMPSAVSSEDRSGSDRYTSEPSFNRPKEIIESDYELSQSVPQYPLAASHNDNEEYPFYLDFLEKFSFLKNVYHTNFEDRYIIQIVDGMNYPVANKNFKIISWLDLPIWESKTYANGENIVFPNIMTPKNASYKLRIEILDGAEEMLFPLPESPDKIYQIKLGNDQKPDTIQLDLLFILDTTGSMKDEIQQLKDTIYSIQHRILQSYPNLMIRIGFVLYKDQKDEYIIQPFQLTDNFQSVDNFLNNVEAGGGGDTPEDVQSALAFAIEKMNWNPESIKLSFLLGDAPPHLDYNQEYTYLNASLDANQNGIKIFTIGASGLNIEGEYVFRQIATLTYSEFIFLTYGETGESDESDIAKVSHHTGSNYSVKNLDDLIVNCVQRELSYQQINPQLADRVIPPEDRAEHIRSRLENIWYQIKKQIALQIDEKPCVILLPIEYEDSQFAELANYLREESIINLINDEAISLLEREKLNTLLDERNLALSGLIDDMDITELPLLLGANVIFTGTLNRSGLDEVLFLRAIQCSNSEIIAAARIRI